VSLLVRSWNLFHGNAKPPERESFLEEMVRLASADKPDLLCLQEVPVWALSRLGDWSGMSAFGEVAMRPGLGPLPATASVGRVVTSIHHGLFRSAFTGQANAILVAPGIRALERERIVLNPRRFRRAQARWLGLGPVARLGWAKERRICQAVRVRLPDDQTALVSNLHATSFPADERLADAEVLRAAVFVDALAQPDELCLLAGDFNVKAERSRTLADLTGPEWGFSQPGEGIDQILVRGADGQVERWPAERRRLGGRLLSDHTPIELRVR
jgi:endonuclease/exonuclease/phosphatase family metal-dependent hydrolase